MRSRVNRRPGFTLVEMMIIVAVIGLLATLMMPSFAKARQRSITQKCIQNERLIFQGVVRYEADFNTTLSSIANNGVQIRNTLINSGYVNHRNAFECPASQTKDYDDYQLRYSATDFTNVHCTILPTVHIYQ